MVIEDRNHIVYVSGALRSDHWPVIRTTAYIVYQRHPPGVVIDFSGVRLLHSGGERTLIAAIDEIERRHLPFTLLNVSSLAGRQLSPNVYRRLAAGAELWWNRFCGTV